MDLHKPKPWHGLREFLKEYLIIVVGVLTALAAEAGVEWLHWRHRVEASERVLRRDLGLVADFASERVAVSRCMNDRLDVIRAAVLASAAHWDAVLSGETDGVRYDHWVYDPPYRVWQTHAWENIAADGTLAHLDPERARNFALLYYRIEWISAGLVREREGAGELQALASRPMALGADGKLRLLQTVARLEMTNDGLAGVSRNILRQIQDAGDLPPLAETHARLVANAPDYMRCRFADEALKDRVATKFFTLGR